MTESRDAVRPKLVLPRAAGALDWYTEVLGADVGPCYRIGDTVVYAELTVLGSTLTAKDADDADAVSEPGPLLDVLIDDPDTVADRMISAGAEIIYPVADQPYGARGGRVRDPYGVQWLLQTPIAMDPDAVQAALDRMAGD